MRLKSQNSKFKVSVFIANLLAIAVLAIGLSGGFIHPKQAQATPTDLYHGEYWNNYWGPGGESPPIPDRTPDYVSDTPDINFNWGTYNPPGPGMQYEDYAVRWTKTTYMAAGTYHFSIAGDDGTRVYVDDNLIIDYWVDQGAGAVHTADVDIAAGQHNIKVEYYQNGAVAEVYFSYSNTTDTDGDGISNQAEQAGPNDGDANNDGIADSEQTNVASFVNPVTNKYAALEVSDTCTIRSASADAESASSKDTAFDYPLGLMNFSLVCDTPGLTADVTQYYYDSSSTGSFRKYNATNHSYQSVPGATISQTTIGASSATKVTYQVTDGQSLDEDGAANGTIIDPSGVATAVIAPPNTGFEPAK